MNLMSCSYIYSLTEDTVSSRTTSPKEKWRYASVYFMGNEIDMHLIFFLNRGIKKKYRLNYHDRKIRQDGILQ